MCGIAGMIYSHLNTSGDRNVSDMLNTINHRGPDDQGTYHNDRLALGQKRLSILDLSQDGRQPMAYMDRYQVIFNGEIYNYLELKEELSAAGYIFHTKTDTEVLLASFDRWGEGCLDHFNGMWAFMLYDAQAQTVFCARDRFGVKPLYYCKTEDGLALASEIKEFTVLPGWKPIGNIPRILDFILQSGCHDFCNETLFSGVYQIRPGEKLCYCLKDNTYRISKWYHLRDKKKKVDISFEDAAKTFAELFEDSVRLRLRSDVKVGSCLSGGLDSSSIVCVMHKLLEQESKDGIQEAVFAENHVKGYDESEYVQCVAKETGVTLHTTTPSFEKVIEKLEQIVWHQDEPFGSTSIIAQWDVYEKAHEVGLTVMLDGQGADEYLAGYTAFQKAYFRELLLTFRWRKLRKSLNQYKALYKNYYYAPYKDLLEVAFSRIIPQKAIDNLKIFIKHLLGKKDRTDCIRNYKKSSNSALTKLQKASTGVCNETIAEMMHTSLPKLVHHQDRNAMAHSIESRAPFLDYRLVEFVFNLPSDYKVNLGVTKYVMREGLKDILPELIRQRMDKLGFATPEDVWIRQNTALFKELLADACDLLSALIVKEQVMASFERQINTKASLDRMFWCLICVAAWAKAFHISFEQ